jgi:hypothetical protein
MGFENEGQPLTAIETVAIIPSPAPKLAYCAGVLLPNCYQKQAVGLSGQYGLKRLIEHIWKVNQFGVP